MLVKSVLSRMVLAMPLLYVIPGERNAIAQATEIKVEALFQVIINVRDMERMVKFYRDVIGLNIIYPSDTPNIYKESFVRFETGDAALVLHAGRTTGNAGQEPRLSFRVANLTKSRDYLLKQGFTASEIRNPAPGVFVVDCKDPEQNTFHLESYKKGDN